MPRLPNDQVLNLPLEPLWARISRKADSSGLRGWQGFRSAISDVMLPRLREFKPDLLLFSAGFDGADGDDGNAQDDVGGLGASAAPPTLRPHPPHPSATPSNHLLPLRCGSDLRDSDFEWATTAICKAAGEHLPRPLPVVSVLEGGYGTYVERKKVPSPRLLPTLSVLPNAADDHVAPSCAPAHCASPIYPCLRRRRGSSVRRWRVAQRLT